jgi:hypothetical protein
MLKTRQIYCNDAVYVDVIVVILPARSVGHAQRDLYAHETRACEIIREGTHACSTLIWEGGGSNPPGGRGLR